METTIEDALLVGFTCGIIGFLIGVAVGILGCAYADRVASRSAANCRFMDSSPL